MNVNNVKFEASFGRSSQLPVSDMPEFVFAGKSNVGKSSLINKLFNRKSLARVSSVPGKTTTVNFFTLDGVRFADLPGYGYARRSASEIERWSELMEGYFSSGRDIRLVIQLLDMRHPPTADDGTMFGFLSDAGYRFVCVLTKCDKLKKNEREEARRRFASDERLKKAVGVIECSAATGEGIAALKELIEKIITEEET